MTDWINSLATYFDEDMDEQELPPYLCLGAKPIEAPCTALDSSDQTVLAFDPVTGVGAYRSGVVQVDESGEVNRRSIGEIRKVFIQPTGPPEPTLRNKLAREQLRRLRTGRRPVFSSLKSLSPLLPVRLVAAGERVVEDYWKTRAYLNSVYTIPGSLFLADGRLNAQSFPGAQAFDGLFRLMAARFVRGVGVAKSGLLVDVLRRPARAIRKRVGDRPFAIPVLREHLDLAYRSVQVTATPKTLRHGSSSEALGGVGAVRFALSTTTNHLCIVEFNLYDLVQFRPLVVSGMRLDHWARQQFGEDHRAVYSWHLLPFVTDRDWEELLIPTLEEIVWCSCTDTEFGFGPRALADVHYQVKLRIPDLEAERRRLIVELGWRGIPPEMVPVEAEDPHKTDPDVVNAMTA